MARVDRPPAALRLPVGSLRASRSGGHSATTFGVSHATRRPPEYHPITKVAIGRIVNGTVKVDDPELEDGTEVFILTRGREEEVHLSAEERAELEAGIAEADRGEMLSGEEFFARLRRYG